MKGIKQLDEELIQFYIVNEDLVDQSGKPVKMSGGKLAVQVAHVATKIAVKATRDSCEGIHIPDDEWKYLIKFGEWFASPLHKKVILRAHEKIIKRIVADIDEKVLHGAHTIDAGLTELKPDQITVVGLFPCKKLELPKYIQRLQLYRG